MSETVTYVIPDGATNGMRELLHAVREGRETAVPELVGALTDAERRMSLPVLKSWRATARTTWDHGHWAVRTALRLAGAGCDTGAAAVVQWLANGDLRLFSDDPSLVLKTLGDRDPAWLAQVAHRLAERRTVAGEEYPLIALLVHQAGCEPPTTDGFVIGWERSKMLAGMTIRERLRDDPFLRLLVPRLFEVPEAGSDFLFSREDDPGWPDALAGLADEGLLSREMLIDGCLSRLTRGGRLGLVRGFLALLTALDLSEEEQAAHLLTWVRMMPDAHALVAARAQEVLAGLDEAGRVESEHLIEASRAALFRPEKKIVRAQLAMLDRAMKRERSRTDELLPVVAEAFGHEEHSLQERALALVVRHRRHASAAVLAKLAASAAQLGPDLRGRAAEVFGDAVAAEDADAPAAENDTLPPVPSAERLKSATPSAAELAEDTGALLRRGGPPARWEHVLNGLVVHAHNDLAGLRAALEPVAAQRTLEWQVDYLKQGLAIVVMSIMGTPLGNVSVARDHFGPQCPDLALRSAPLVRAAEIGTRLGTDPLPFLLSTPTWSTGTIEASELVARLAAYERTGTEPGQADFSQALLRLDRRVPSEARAAAAVLTSPAGLRLADWLASEGLPDPAVWRDIEPLRPRTPRPGVLVRTEALRGREDHPEPFRSLLGAFDPVGSPCRCGSGWECSPHTLAILPQHREVVAARMLAPFGSLAESDAVGVYTPVLPTLAESGGPAGPATHLLVAYGLGARRTDEQLYAVDAMLVLAARGQLDAARLSRDIADLISLRRLKLQRVVAALREAVRSGAYATVWAVLAAALPLLLKDGATRTHGLPAMLTIAAECAERCGAAEAIPEIDELAARSGSSQLVKQARRIRKATGMPPMERH
ncbi:DUF6493 family protein [Streptomyces sp. NPDC127084]|uniref:DUF7824 domain-containing protein n=1 Tax=Streptomyces sp. NPDC127084 TaxID=3347133 RepID=UPI0036591A27